MTQDDGNLLVPSFLLHQLHQIHHLQWTEDQIRERHLSISRVKMEPLNQLCTLSIELRHFFSPPPPSLFYQCFTYLHTYIQSNLPEANTYEQGFTTYLRIPHTTSCSVFLLRVCGHNQPLLGLFFIISLMLYWSACGAICRKKKRKTQPVCTTNYAGFSLDLNWCNLIELGKKKKANPDSVILMVNWL